MTLHEKRVKDSQRFEIKRCNVIVVRWLKTVFEDQIKI